MNGRKALTGLLALLCALTLLSGAMAAAGTLRNGDEGQEVMNLQIALNQLGYATGGTDGKFGTRTENAVRKFQKANGLNVDGLAGARTQTLIYQKVGTAAAPAATPKPQAAAPAAQTQPAAGSIFGGNYTKLQLGSRGERVTLLQQSLAQLGYTPGRADGSFGNATYKAVVAFQKAEGLTKDGIAGKKTLTRIETRLSSGAAPVAETPAPTAAPTAAPAPAETVTTDGYTIPTVTLRKGATGAAVMSVQQRLKELGYYTGKLDGSYGNGTMNAVRAFQKKNGLGQDGLVGRLTSAKLFSSSALAADAAGTAGASTTTTSGKMSAPSKKSIKLLHWFNEVKPSLRGGKTILVFDPATSYCWTLKLLSLGRHADAEPLTADDTAAMLKAFGGVNTWNQKAVYVRLPSGTWTLASTHDMPHESGSIRDNNFDGHLCVHFLRDMDECEKNDPKYGVSNQKTIRAAWKALTGETVN